MQICGQIFLLYIISLYLRRLQRTISGWLAVCLYFYVGLFAFDKRDYFLFRETLPYREVPYPKICRCERD